jgi:SsrA-binding protein
MPGRRDDGERTVASNRRARHDYAILERFEAGIALTGGEVKSLRAGRASLAEAFARVREGEVWLEGMHIPRYEAGDERTHLPVRPRKLLLHRREIKQLRDAQQQERLALVPLRVYFTHGIAKVELALARGKKVHDKRETVKERDWKREQQRLMRNRG